MFEVANRSEESWGPLAKCDDATFSKLINQLDAKTKIKDHLKKQKKLKTYKVTFLAEEPAKIYGVGCATITKWAREGIKARYV